MPSNNASVELKKLIDAQKKAQAAAKTVKAVLAAERAAEQIEG